MKKKKKQAYEKWLEILDKGIGETLEEAGVFDAAFTGDDDDDDYYYHDRDGYGYGYDGNNGGGRERSPPQRRRRRRSRTDTDNLYDKYTNYGYEGSRGDDDDDGGGGAGGGESRREGDGGGVAGPRGRGNERGSDYDDARCLTSGVRTRKGGEFRYLVVFLARYRVLVGVWARGGKSLYT